MARVGFLTGLLVLNIFICAEMKTQALDAPNLAVSSTIITVTDHVTLTCEPPLVSVERCCFYIDGTPAPFSDPSCKQTQPGTQLLFIANKSPPAEVDVSCFYTDNRRSPSPHSHKSSIIIQRVPAPGLTVRPRVITESDSVTLSCQTPSSAPDIQCYLYTARTRHIWRAPSCQQNFTGTELLQRSQQSSPAVVDMKCYYTVQQGSVTSPWSDISSITLQAGGFGEAATSVPALEGSSDNKITENFETVMTEISTYTTPEKETLKWAVIVARCGVFAGIILLGSALMCIKRRRGDSLHTRALIHGGVTPSAGNTELYSMITSVPGDVFPKGSVELKGHEAAYEDHH